MTVDVARLRRESRERALARPRLPFAGNVEDSEIQGVAVRIYSPDQPASYEVVFLHGGYGLFGDLDGQDGYCRLLASGLGARVTSVAYGLAPESTLEQAATETIAVVESRGTTPLLCGDSAGGAVALRAARDVAVAGLLLTNPNVDLSLRRVDDTATGGPDREIAAWSFARWAPDSPDLATGLPELSAFIAVGDQDSLLPDSLHLADALPGSVLLVLPGRSHGFVSDVEVARELIAAMRDFLD